MKKILLISCLSMIASAEVLVNESVKADPVTGVKLVTVLLTIKGDKRTAATIQGHQPSLASCASK